MTTLFADVSFTLTVNKFTKFTTVHAGALNIGIPVFKNRKIQHFLTICETGLFEVAHFQPQNTFISKAKFIFISYV